MSEVFVSTDPRRAWSHGVIRRTMGTYIPKVQVRIPSRAMGTFSLMPSALSFVFL